MYVVHVCMWYMYVYVPCMSVYVMCSTRVVPDLYYVLHSVYTGHRTTHVYHIIPSTNGINNITMLQ